MRRLPAGATNLTLEDTELVPKSENLGSKPGSQTGCGALRRKRTTAWRRAKEGGLYARRVTEPLIELTQRVYRNTCPWQAGSCRSSEVVTVKMVRQSIKVEC